MATQEIPDPVKDFKGFQSSLFKSLVAATSAANAINVTEVGFYRSLDRSFAKDVDQAGIASLSTGNELLEHCAIDCGIFAKPLEDADDAIHRYGPVTYICDSLLEKAVSLHIEEKGIDS